MRWLRSLVCLGIFIVLDLVVIPKSNGGLVVAQRNFRPSAPCIAEADLARDVRSLSGTYSEAVAAGQRLRKLSRRSSTCKQNVIAAVMKAMDAPNLDIRRDQASNDLWREGAVLLGDLKAFQALDLLLSHITMNDGEWSVTMIHQPALEGIIRMGPMAIPKLKTLLINKDPDVRQASVYCIAWIGGSAARDVLQQAIPKESDSCVRRFMSVSVDTINLKAGGLKTDHGEWMNAFLCKN